MMASTSIFFLTTHHGYTSRDFWNSLLVIYSVYESSPWFNNPNKQFLVYTVYRVLQMVKYGVCIYDSMSVKVIFNLEERTSLWYCIVC